MAGWISMASIRSPSRFYGRGWGGVLLLSGGLGDLEKALASLVPTPHSPPGNPGGEDSSHRALDQHLLGFGDRLGGVEAFGADVGAVHDGVAAVEAERVLELVEPLAGHLVAAVGEPAIGL